MREELLKRDSETKLDYIRRIVCGKLVDKTIDEDYTELSELIFGKPYSSDVARRMFYGVRALLDVLDLEQVNNITETDLLKQLEEKREEIARETIKLQTEKLDFNKNRRIDVRNEMLHEKFLNSAKTIETPNFKPIVTSKGNREGVLGISDFHFGKAFICINNSYSEEEFYNRMNKLAQETIDICREQGIYKLHVLNCGDDVEGMNLRVSQLKSLQLGFTDQVIKLARYMVKFLNRLSEELEIVYHHVLEGNHSELRCFNDKSWTLENMERIIIAYINDLTENNPRITVPQYNGKYALFEVLGHNVYARHGHKRINENKILGDASQQLRVFIDFAYFGHLHHSKRKTVGAATGYNKQVIYLPSIMGEDEYSEDFYFGGSKGCATLDIFEENRGIRNTYDIVLN